jgi:hypothetical protein
MDYLLPQQSIEKLPLILAGPMLRHTTSASVTVWVALKQACQVTLQVLETSDRGRQIGNCVLQGRGKTIAVGQHLHIVAVTAYSDRDLNLASLLPDRLYAYDLAFTPQDRHATPQNLLAAIATPSLPTPSISYFEHQYPTFVLPPSRLADLRIVHGSCRKPHGDGFDALPILDCLLAEAADQVSDRPQQLFLTGDQIYGDDVADPLLWVASHLGDLLLGWEEELPIGRRAESGFYRPTELTFGKRAEVATRKAGFTAGLRDKRAKVNSHLLSLGEYYAAYLLAWSPVCWCDVFPHGREMTRDRQITKVWDREVRDMKQFIHTLPQVRRALANIAVYTIFDDHDVSDDWNLNQAWCLRVLGKPLGRRAVQNALLAYAVFQGWGNTPDRFIPGTNGFQLLAAAEIWSARGGKDPNTAIQIAQLVGLPPCDPSTGLPQFVTDEDVLILDRDPSALTWHYQIQSDCHQVIVLDTRTWRGYPLGKSAISPPHLLSPSAFDRQLLQPLQASSASPLATVVIAPTNLFGLEVIDWIHHWAIKRKKVFATDAGDAWNVNTAALAQLLNILCGQRRRVTILSGDIHYGSAVRLSRRQITGDDSQESVLVQFTSSALKNEEKITRLLHTRLKHWLLPEKTRRWVGWEHPPQMLTIPLSSHPIAPHDWECSLEWIYRQPSTIARFGHRIPWLIPHQFLPNLFSAAILQALLWRQSRWFQDGREVVGLNNLAVVQWQSPEAIQDLYWFSPWLPKQIVSSRFVATLADCGVNLPPIRESG